MNSISEPILEATSILIDAKLAGLKYDRTVRGIIYSIINVDSGIYYVKFESNVFTAYAEDVSKKYKEKEEVYIRIPEGDFSNKKIIAGRVTEQSLSQGQMTQLTNSIIGISPTFDKFYTFNKDTPWKVVAGAVQNSNTNGIDYIYGREDNVYQSNQFHGLFQQYANKYEYIRIKADFKTQFHDIHTRGNYGIEVAFFAKGENNTISTVTYRLDFESFSGDPYSLSVFSPQQIIFKAQTNYLLGLKYIKLFQEGFNYDTQITNYDTGDRTAITNIPNIFAQNVQINYVDIVDLTKEPYYCYIAAPKGSIFSSGTSSIDLEARLLSYGESVNIDKCKYKWFKRDLSVLVGNDSYDKDAGFGWVPIDNDKSSLTIVANEIIYQQLYKCIITYNNKIAMSARREVLNVNNNYGYHIEQITQGDTIKLQLVNDKTDDVLTGNWYISYPDGSYNSISGGKNRNYINIEDYLTYTSIVFYCEVYSYNKSKIVGTIEHTVFNSESEEDVTISYVGEDSFRYDANGDITIEDSEKERTIWVQLAWKEGYGTSYRVEWIGPDGKNIPRIKPTTSEDGYKPKDSMMENIWIDESNILHYNIKCKYKVNYNNNTFTVRIITIDEKVYTFNKEILFIKDGDQGTNGTTYVTAIRPCSSGGDKLSGFQALRYYNNGWRKSLDLRCYVYKDGELINNNSKYTITYKWYPTGVSLNRDNVDKITVSGRGSISPNSGGPNLQRYVRISTRIRDNVNDREITIYALYPIDVIYGTILNDNLIDISDIPSYIKYTASGINPSFYSNNIIFKYNKYDYTGSSITAGITSLTTNVLEVEMRDGHKYLKPATSFIFEENTVGILKCEYDTYNFIIHPIIMYLDTYGNEAVNGWDGTKLSIDEEKGQYIFAPQIGAGEKDSANRFTGVIMGKDSASIDPISGQKLIGLYGYQSGVSTFGLMQNGRAFFGSKSGGGQIIIDGTSAKIYGGGNSGQQGGEAQNGMTITLANLRPSQPERTEAIKVGQGKFLVYYSGKMEATEADISGSIYAQGGQIGCDSNKNGGWYIEPNKLYSGSASKGNYVELNSAENSTYAIIVGKNSSNLQLEVDSNTGLITKSNAPFLVTRSGAIYAYDASIKGSIEADYIIANKKGKIADWTLEKNRLYSNPIDSEENKKCWVELNSNGKYSIMIGVDTSKYPVTSRPSDIAVTDIPFFVTPAGKIQATEAEISGTIYAQSGAIGCSNKRTKDGWIIEKYKLYSGTGNNTIALGSNPDEAFRIWAGRSEGGKGYDSNKEPNDRITDPAKFVVTKDGFVYMKDCYVEGQITTDKGKIGGWEITSSEIKSESAPGRDSATVLNKRGSAKFGNFTITSGGTIKLSDNNSDVTTDYDATNIETQDSANAPTFSVSKSGRLHCTNANIDGNVIIGGTITADHLYLRDGSNKTENIISKNGSNSQIGGKYINCKGLTVGDRNSNNYFDVSPSGVVSIKTPNLSIVSEEGTVLEANTIEKHMSEIRYNASRISLSVSGEEVVFKGYGSDEDDTGIKPGIYSKTGTKNTITASLDGITLEATKTTVDTTSGITKLSSTIELKATGITTKSANIVFDGLVTFKSLNNPTTTIIDGGAIKTHTISTKSLKVDEDIEIKNNSGSITIQDAQTSEDQILIRGRSASLRSTEGDVYLDAGTASVLVHRGEGGYVTIQPKLNIGGTSLDDYIKQQIPSDYATQQWVEDQGYLTAEGAAESYATTGYVSELNKSILDLTMRVSALEG